MFGRRNDKNDKHVFAYPTIKVKNISCARCRHQFFIKDFNSLKRESHIPLLLPCGHALCERCVQSGRGLCCNVCRIPGTRPDNNEENASLPEENTMLPVHIYVLGLVGLSQSRPVCPDDPDLEFYQPIKSKIRQSFDKERCSECLKKADSRCLDCNCLFCNFCYSKLHNMALLNHRRMMFPNSQNGIDPALDTHCPAHSSNSICFYCGQCDVTGCSECMILMHNGHTAFTLTQRNELLKPEFERAYNKVAETLQRVHQTQKKLSNTLIFPEQLQNNGSVEASINRHFAQLHGVLQNLEKEILDRMQDQRRNLRQNLDNIRLKLESHEEVLRDGLLTAASVKDYLSQIDLSKVIKKLDIMAGVPCHLVKDGEESHEKLKFEVDNSVIERLKNHCSINIPPVASFTLSDSENLPPDYNLEPLVPQDLPSPWETLTRVTNVSPTPSIASSIATVTSCQTDIGFPTKGSTELVRLTHIDDPSSFYVHPITQLRDIDDFHRNIEEYAMKNNKLPSEIFKKKLYIVKYEQFWYRGRVMDSFKTGLGQELYVVNYVDYGNTKAVPIQDMRDMSPLFATQSAFALHCRLHDISPKGEKWSREAVGAMNNMIDQKDMALTMHVHDVLDDLCSVDIVKNTTDKLTSFRDSLIFMGYGSFVTSQKLMKLNPNAVRKYFYGELKLSKYLTVMCTNVESPDCVYVVRTSKNIEQMERMTAEMTREYKKGKSKKLIMYSPEIGMACAAPLDKCWYRGIITDIPAEKLVEVFYVDTGYKRNMFFDQIRKMQQKYMNFATQAIKIKLKDVAPLPSDRGKWNSNTVNFMESHIGNIKVKAIAFNEIENTAGFCKSYSACLYMMDDTNFNALLVGVGHAISTGESSQCSTVQKQKDKPPKYRSNGTLSNLSSAFSGSTRSLASSRSERITDDVDPFKFRVVVSNAKSPDCIYVADPSRKEINLCLYDDMQSFYNTNSAIFEEPVKKDQMCSVYSTKDKAFFRAKVTDIKSESEINVFFIDLGVEETVSIDDIQPLDKKFLSTPRYQFKVKLAGITPCGGSSSWPSSSCQKLREIIYENESCKFFISKVGETVDDGIPVELWVKQSKTEGPLAPTKIEMNSISRMLVLSGHAIPVKDFHQNAQRILAVEFKRQLNKSEESLDCMSEITWSVKEGHEDTIVESDISSNSASDSDSDTASQSVKTEDSTSSESIQLPPNMAAWIQPLPIAEDSFIAIPTYIDHDCFVYLHPKKACDETLKYIEAELDKRYCRSKIRPYDKVWKEGDMCVAQYHCNKKWYRGVVKKINNENNVQVEFVDYGNVEDCEIGTLKKRIILGNLPIQCTKCVIHGLYSNAPDGRWSEKELDDLHQLLVEKECEVTVLDRTGISPQILHISVTLLKPERSELIAFLCEAGMNIQNPNGSCTESESPNNSVMYNTIKRASAKESYAQIEDVVIEGYLKDCETFPKTEVFESEDECLDLTCEKADDVTETSPSIEIKDPVHAGKIEHPGSVKMNNANTAEVASSIESLSWYDMVNMESKLISSTPQVGLSIASSQTDPSESVMESSYTDVVDFIGEDVKKIVMEIGNISRSSLTVFHGHMKGGDSKLAKMYVEQYESMAYTLQQVAADQPVIENPEVGMPCIALYIDNQWYRGLLVKCELNPFSSKLEVKVLFVDFGNEEIVDATRLRQTDEKWMSIPAMAIKCRLYNLVPGSHRPKEETSRCMIEHLENVAVVAKINERHNKTLDVELFLDEDCTDPALTELIEKGLFKLKTKKD